MNQVVIFLEPKGTALEVVRAAHRRGFYTVAISSDQTLLSQASAPYESVVPLIDEIIPVDRWNDEAYVLSICSKLEKRLPIAGVYSGLDPCAQLLAKIRGKYSLPTHRAEDVAVVLNKFLLRQKLQKLGLSKLQSFHSDEVKTWTKWNLKGPAYFKPVHGFFSAYVRRCENMANLQDAQNMWHQGSKNDPRYVENYLRSSDEYHLEEAFDGELLSVEAIVSGGKFETLGLLSRILYSRDPVVEMGSCFPYPHALSDKIISLVKDAHQALGLTDGATHTEVIVNKTGDIEIIDLNPRFVGADVLQSINHAYGIKIEESLLDYALGIEPKINPSVSNFSCLQYFLPPKIEQLESIDFPVGDEVRFHTTFIKPGSKISDSTRQLDYLGCYLTVQTSFDQAIKRSKELRPKVRINKSHEGVY